MAKKNGKSGKDKDKKKLAKKPSAKAPAKKAAKSAKKAAPAKKAAVKAAGKSAAKKAPAKAAAKVTSKAAKSVLKAVAKAVVGAAKKAVEKVEKPAKAVKVKAPVAAKPGKPDAREARAPKVVEPVAPDETELDLGEEEDATDEEIVLTDAEGRRYCRVKDCDQLSAVDGYCRYHYLALWKKIQVRKKILSEGKLERYIEELTARYPDKFLEMLRKDLRSEKEFLLAIQELEIDESAVDNEFEDEAQTYIDEVRGMEPTGARDDDDF